MSDNKDKNKVDQCTSIFDPNASIRQNALAILQSAKGERITRVGLEQWAVQLVLGSHQIYIEADWSYINSVGEIIDEKIDVQRRNTFELWSAIGQDILELEISGEPFDNLTLKLSNGCSIIAYGNDDDYEDWSFDDIVCMGRTSI